MGMSFSCPGTDYDALDEDIEAVIVRSISFQGDDMKTMLRSVSFNGVDSEPTISKSIGQGKMVVEGPVSFKKPREMDPINLETMISIKNPNMDVKGEIKINSFKVRDSGDPFHRSNSLNARTTVVNSPTHEAAVTLQKVYKSFRTRRKLADCAVLVEQRWWKLLDFAELKRTSVSFFDIAKPESAVSRWSRAGTRVAKVGKGLSKDEKARKLALQHWLEAIDPRHRYGHNIHFYFDKWLQCASTQPFFYWLDVGEGREINLESCPRSKLQEQCIKYLGPMEREAYEVIVQNGKFYYKHNGKLLDTSEGPKNSKWIFVLSTSKNLYVGQKRKGTFQHSSFLAGGATSAAGRLVVENGILMAVWPHSGHYRPTEENFNEFISFLEENKVDLSNVKKCPTDDEEELSKNGEYTNSGIEYEPPHKEGQQSLNKQEQSDFSGAECVELEDYYVSHMRNLFEKGQDVVPRESILRRINSKKGTKSYQLGKQLAFKWTTGAGPRIGCVRDYPSELQSHALEQVNLSPRCTNL